MTKKIEELEKESDQSESTKEAVRLAKEEVEEIASIMPEMSNKVRCVCLYLKHNHVL